MKFSKLLLVLLLTPLIVACSSTGPMQMPYGPINTPAFEPIVLDLVNDGSEKVLYKSEIASLFVGNERQSIFSIKSFFITENGAYCVAWNNDTYQYSMVYSISSKEIKKLEERTIERDYLPDFDIIVITDNKEDSVGISVPRILAAKKALEKAINNAI